MEKELEKQETQKLKKKWSYRDKRNRDNKWFYKKSLILRVKTILI